jgi:dTDP-4-amino-4,6-dideoxygalactose transaminase
LALRISFGFRASDFGFFDLAMRRIYLSPPHMGAEERRLLLEAFDSNWIAPLGPHVDAFEREFAERVEVGHAAALSSGTAALHLALRLLGVGQDDEVLVSDFTFAATANAVTYVGARPVFIDSDAATWNMDSGLLEEELKVCAARGRLPKAVIVVDLYGQCADYDPILRICEEYGVPVIEDAAEALGATYRGSPQPASGHPLHDPVPLTPSRSMNPSAPSPHPSPPLRAGARVSGGSTRESFSGNLSPTGKEGGRQGKAAGTLGVLGVFSFNGNKIITTSGGGMLVSERGDWMAKARYWATQARDPAPHYEHSEIGNNYRLSNLLAAVGRGQLGVLDQRVAQRRANNAFYREALSDLPGIEFMPIAPYGEWNGWLTCITVDPTRFGVDRETIRQRLEKRNIESRPVWKPMHLQPVYRDCRVRGGSVSAGLFERGLCLPSGSNLSDEERDVVVDAIRRSAVSR